MASQTWTRLRRSLLVHSGTHPDAGFQRFVELHQTSDVALEVELDLFDLNKLKAPSTAIATSPARKDQLANASIVSSNVDPNCNAAIIAPNAATATKN